MKTLGIAIFLISASTAASAAATVQTPGTKLLVCTDRVTYLGSCALTSTELAPSQAFEADLHVTYKFPCKGPAVEFKIMAQTSPNDPKAVADYPLTFSNEFRTFKVTGYGPFTVIDRNPNKTLNRPFDKMCDLTIESLSIKASTTTKENWQGDLASLNKLLTSYSDNVNSWGALAVLEPAFSVYDSLVKNVSADFSSRTELLNASKELLACVDGTNDEGCETIIGKVMDAKQLIGFSDDEGKKLTKLQTALFNADFSGVLTCEDGSSSCVTIDKFLQKYLTTDDIKKLTDAREKLKVVIGASNKLLEYETLLKSTADDIIRLKAVMKEYE